MRLVITFALALAPLLTGCAMGSAKIWAQDTTGGILALNGDEGKAMEDADKKMAANTAEMPRTAGPMPLVASLGALLLAFAGMLTFLRVRRES
jgi:hypothetical protein